MKKLLVLLIVIALVAGAGFAGYAYYTNNKNENKKQGGQQSTNTNADPSEGGKYLVIKEWGVRMRLNDNIMGAKYKVSQSTLTLTTSSFDSIIPSCQKVGAMAVGRVREGDPSNTSTPEEIAAATKVGDYYYLITGPHFSCLVEPTQEQDSIYAQARVGFTKAYETLEEIPTN